MELVGIQNHATNDVQYCNQVVNDVQLDESTGEVEGTSTCWEAKRFNVFNRHLGDDSKLI